MFFFFYRDPPSPEVEAHVGDVGIQHRDAIDLREGVLVPPGPEPEGGVVREPERAREGHDELVARDLSAPAQWVPSLMGT